MVAPAPPSLGPTPQPERLLALLRTMLRIRVFEETFERLFLEGSVPGFVHLYIGEEAIATGVCAALERDDFITSTHRGHGHAIAKGVGLDRIAAELLGKRTGVCRGKGGSMHVADFQLGILGANGIVGGGFGLATGAALSARLRGTRQVAVCFFGDGAANKGTFHEALNLAAVRRLPAVFVCENNGYAQFTSTRETLAVPDVAERAAAYDVPGVVVDGNDVLAVQDAAREAVARARRGDGPSLLEMKTYRQRGHYVGDPERYRGADEVQDWRARDPIPRFEQRLLDAGLATPDLLRALHAEAEAEMAGALRFAQDSPLPDPADALEDLFAPPSAWLPPDLPAAPPLQEISAVEAERDALRLAMRHDPTVFALGLDIQWGGSFGQFAGLSDEFGPERVVAMPISEANMIATAVGAAITGCRPIVSMNFVDFTLGAMDELVNQAAKIRYMFGGQVRVPLVLRSSDGAVRSAAAQHSQSLEALFAHVPGLKIVTPSSPADVKPLLLAAIADDNPVIFLEHKVVGRQRGPAPLGWAVARLGEAAIRRRGEHVTLISFSLMVQRALEAAEALAGDGISVEVIDLRSLVPLDLPTLAASVRRTHRAVILHEACRSGGYGAELAARLQEEVFDFLEAPILRVAARDVPMPFSPPLEQAVLPQIADVVAAIRATLA